MSRFQAVPFPKGSSTVRVFSEYLRGSELGKWLSASELVFWRGEFQVHQEVAATALVGSVIRVELAAVAIERAHRELGPTSMPIVSLASSSGNSCGLGGGAGIGSEKSLEDQPEEAVKASERVAKVVEAAARRSMGAAEEEGAARTNEGATGEAAHEGAAGAPMEGSTETEDATRDSEGAAEEAGVAARENDGAVANEAERAEVQVKSSSAAGGCVPIQYLVILDSRRRPVVIPKPEGAGGKPGGTAWGPDSAQRLRAVKELSDELKQEMRKHMSADPSLRSGLVESGVYLPALWDRVGDSVVKWGSKFHNICYLTPRECTACGKEKIEGSFSPGMWQREPHQRIFCKQCFSTLRCTACDRIKRPSLFSRTQREEKPAECRRCKVCIEKCSQPKSKRVQIEGPKAEESQNSFHVLSADDEDSEDEDSEDESADPNTDQSDPNNDSGDSEEEDEEATEDVENSEDSSSNESSEAEDESETEDKDGDFNQAFESAQVDAGPTRKELQEKAREERSKQEEEEEAEWQRIQEQSCALTGGQEVELIERVGSDEIWGFGVTSIGDQQSVQLDPGESVWVVKTWGGKPDEMVEVASRLNENGDPAGWLECTTEEGVKLVSCRVNSDCLALKAYDGQEGTLSNADTDEDIPVYYGANKATKLGSIEEGRVVRVIHAPPRPTHGSWFIQIVDMEEFEEENTGAVLSADYLMGCDDETELLYKLYNNLGQDCDARTELERISGHECFLKLKGKAVLSI